MKITLIFLLICIAAVACAPQRASSKSVSKNSQNNAKNNVRNRTPPTANYNRKKSQSSATASVSKKSKKQKSAPKAARHNDVIYGNDVPGHLAKIEHENLQWFPNGGYHFEYLQNDLHRREETGTVAIDPETGNYTLDNVVGSYEYIRPDGKKQRVEYIADRERFRPNVIVEDSESTHNDRGPLVLPGDGQGEFVLPPPADIANPDSGESQESEESNENQESQENSSEEEGQENTEGHEVEDANAELPAVNQSAPNFEGYQENIPEDDGGVLKKRKGSAKKQRKNVRTG